MHTEPQQIRRTLFHRLWHCRWAFLRLAVAAWLLVTMVNDNPSRLARLQFSRLPNFDYVGEVRQLREQKRYGEAVMVAEAGLDATDGLVHDTLERERDATLAEQHSLLRKVAQFGRGAIIGQGDSIEELLGAVTADMLVVGDVRDILIQGSRLAVDHEADPVILTLSGVGLATTFEPEVDWAA